MLTGGGAPRPAQRQVQARMIKIYRPSGTKSPEKVQTGSVTHVLWLNSATCWKTVWTGKLGRLSYSNDSEHL